MGAVFVSLVDVGDLLALVVASATAGIAVAVFFSIAIWGATVHYDLSLEGRDAASYGALAIGGAGLVAALATMVAGLILLGSG